MPYIAQFNASDSSIALDYCALYQVFVCMYVGMCVCMYVGIRLFKNIRDIRVLSTTPEQIASMHLADPASGAPKTRQNTNTCFRSRCVRRIGLDHKD